MWRDADTEACDLKSNALIARDVAINRLVVEGAESFALRALATALRVWLDCGGMPDGIDEIFTIRLPAHPVNAEMRSSFVRHHIIATFELRAGAGVPDARIPARWGGGVVKAASPQGRAQREP